MKLKVWKIDDRVFAYFEPRAGGEVRIFGFYVKAQQDVNQSWPDKDIYQTLNLLFARRLWKKVRKKPTNHSKMPGLHNKEACGPPKNGNLALWLGTHRIEKQICST